MQAERTQLRPSTLATASVNANNGVGQTVGGCRKVPISGCERLRMWSWEEGSVVGSDWGFGVAGRLETRPPVARRPSGKPAADAAKGSRRGWPTRSRCGKRNPPRRTGTTPAKPAKLTPMSCPTPCRARVQGEYFTSGLFVSIAHWRDGNRQWKPPADSSFAITAEPRSLSAAAATGARSTAPRRPAALPSRQPAAVTRRAGMAASSTLKEPAVTGFVSRR